MATKEAEMGSVLGAALCSRQRVSECDVDEVDATLRMSCIVLMSGLTEWEMATWKRAWPPVALPSLWACTHDYCADG